ncbi:MAG: hypothetical protein DRR06_20765 [Gammaproteobacteria bacterium]|nr:MAG: hypothetical protein DRR06_20765 [Gammaproteobacteria bacterium]
MDAVERDDFVHALGQTLAFYGKDLSMMQTSFWVTACGDKSVFQLKRALIEYTKVGKFAPKPADILSIVDNMGARHGRKEKTLPPPVTSCPPEVTKAWMWFIGRMAKGSKNLDGLFDKHSDVDVATQEKYLHTINHEAHKYGTPDAVPEEFKLKEVWG